jgi:hypothetical protein
MKRTRAALLNPEPAGTRFTDGKARIRLAGFRSGNVGSIPDGREVGNVRLNHVRLRPGERFIPEPFPSLNATERCR